MLKSLFFRWVARSSDSIVAFVISLDAELDKFLAKHDAEVAGFELFTGAGSAANLRRYRRAGYRPAGSPAPGVVRLVKGPARRPAADET